MKPSAWILFSLKLAITAGLIAYLLGKVDIAPVVDRIRAVHPMWVAAAIGVMVLQLALIAVRWNLVARLVDARMRIGQAVRLTWIGQFFNQVLPSSIGGDAVRAWLAAAEGIPLGRAVTAILCDRTVGFLALVVFISGAFFAWPMVAPGDSPLSGGLRAVALLGVAALATLFVFGAVLARRLMRYRITRPAGKLVRDLRAVIYSGSSSIAIATLAAAVQVLLVTAIYLCAKAMSIQLDFGAALLVVPAIMLVSMIPLSFAGWGVREGAMVFGLGVLGIAAAEALAVSVVFGLLQIVVGLPGGALWLTRTGAARRAVIGVEDSK